MHIKYGKDRNELTITCLEDTIEAESPVRALDTIIDELYQRGIIDIPTGTNNMGCRAYSAIDLSKLLIYGCMNGVSSSRNLEKWTYINKEVCWLIKEQHPSYKTIADFRKNNTELIGKLFSGTIELLKEENFVNGKVWVIDGSKTKANAKRDMISVKNLKKQITDLDKDIYSILEAIEQADAQDSRANDKEDNDSRPSSPPLPNADKHKLRKKLYTLKAEITDKREILQEAEVHGRNYHSPTDRDALLVRTRRGKCAGYNPQYVIDGEHHFIVGMQLAEEANDINSLYRCIQAVSEATGISPGTIIADKGYANLADIRKVYDKISKKVFVNLVTNIRDKAGLVFTYDKAEDEVICPQGRHLTLRGRRKVKGTEYHVYRCRSCEGCAIKEKCTPKAKSRTYMLADEHEFNDVYREMMNTPEAQAITAKRKTIPEHIFGSLAHMMRYNGCMLRGKAKVTAELYLYSMAYNLKRMIKLGKTKPGTLNAGECCIPVIKHVHLNISLLSYAYLKRVMVSFRCFLRLEYQRQQYMT